MTAAHILLVGRVGVDITVAALDAELREIGNRPIHITLRSPGGSASEGEAIFHRLREHSEHAPVTVTSASSYSAGTVVFLAGDRRLIASNAYVQVHNTFSQGLPEGMTPQFLRDLAASLERQSTALCNLIADRTGLARDVVLELLAQEACMTPSQAIDLGFAHVAVDPIY